MFAFPTLEFMHAEPEPEAASGGLHTSQYFIEVPQNQTVNEGDTILLRCRVGNLQGIVQWTRNGFAMGRSTVYLIYPRTRSSSIYRAS